MPSRWHSERGLLRLQSFPTVGRLLEPWNTQRFHHHRHQPDSLSTSSPMQALSTSHSTASRSSRCPPTLSCTAHQYRSPRPPPHAAARAGPGHPSEELQGRPRSRGGRPSGAGRHAAQAQNPTRLSSCLKTGRLRLGRSHRGDRRAVEITARTATQTTDISQRRATRSCTPRCVSRHCRPGHLSPTAPNSHPSRRMQHQTSSGPQAARHRMCLMPASRTAVRWMRESMFRMNCHTTVYCYRLRP